MGTEILSLEELAEAMTARDGDIKKNLGAANQIAFHDMDKSESQEERLAYHLVSALVNQLALLTLNIVVLRYGLIEEEEDDNDN